MVTPLLRAKELLAKDIADHDDELDDPYRWVRPFLAMGMWQHAS